MTGLTLPIPRRANLCAALIATFAAVIFASAWLPGRAEAAPVLGVNIVNPTDPAELAEAEQLGAKRVRVFLHPGMFQPQPFAALNQGAVGPYRSFIDRMTSRGIGVDFVIISSPGTGPNIPPASPGHLADFFIKFAGQFAGRGISYEIWNEQDDAAWWIPRPDNAKYAAVLKASYSAIKSVDSSAVVVLGPTTGNNYEYIDALYKEGIKGYFDAAAVHTDTACLVAPPSEFYRENNRIGRYAFLGYREVRATMLANGDDKPIWMTEFGWSSSNGGANSCKRGLWAGKKPSGVSEAEQAQNLTSAVRCMSADPYLQVASWFTMRDAASHPTDELRHYGLLRSNGVRKPAWHQMYGLLHGTISSAPSNCADLAGPQVVIEKPTANQRFRGPLKLRIRVADPSGLVGIRYFRGNTKFTSVNKASIVNSGKPVRTRWFGAKKLKPGKHTIKVVAVDKKGNQSAAQVEVTKLPEKKKKRKKRK